jgi:hypothetical protein
MNMVQKRLSPDGRPIRIHDTIHETPEWLARRRNAYRFIDVVAEAAKRSVRRWFAPRPRPTVS